MVKIKSLNYTFKGIAIVLLTLQLNMNDVIGKKNGINMYSIKAERFICYSSDFVLNPICKLKLVSRDKQLIYANINFTKIIPSAMVHFRFYYKYNVSYQPFPIDIREDICGFLNNKKSLHIANHIYAGLKDHISPNPLNCPMYGNITVNNAPFNVGFFPQMLPAGQYRVEGRLYSSENETILKGNFYVVVAGENAINFG